MLLRRKLPRLLLAILAAVVSVNGSCVEIGEYPIVYNCSMIYNPQYFNIGRYMEYGRVVTLIFDQSYMRNITKSTFNFAFQENYIEGLCVTNSHLTNFEEDMFRKLKYLDFTNNNLTSLVGEQFNMPSLLALNISGNFLETLSDDLFDNLSELVQFNVSTNKISAISAKNFKNLKNLKSMDLSGNEIRVLPTAVFGQLNKLEFLDLSKNRLEDLNVGTFIGANSLLELDLSGNKLKTLSSVVFQNAAKLNVLKLNGNELEALFPQDLLEFTMIRSIEFSGNNFKCVVLSKLLKKFKSLNIEVAFGEERENLSLHGIKCHGDIEKADHNVGNENVLEKFFDFDFKQSNFYKFFEQYKELNNEKHLKQDELKYLISGISDTEYKKHVDNKLILIVVLLSLMTFIMILYLIHPYILKIKSTKRVNSNELDAII